MNENTRRVTFTFRDKAVSAAWRDLIRDLGCRQSDRTTEGFPVWYRVDGKAYTIWLSEVVLSNYAPTETEWQIRLETLSTLPTAGTKRWTLIQKTLTDFLRTTESRYTIEDSLTPSQAL